MSLRSRSQTIAVEILDPRELDIPNVGMVLLQDPETGELRELNTGDRRVRRRYAAAARMQRERNRRAFRRAGVGHLLLRTDRDWVSDTARFALQAPPSGRPTAHRRPRGSRGDVSRAGTALAALLLIPALVVLYVALQRRRGQYAVRFTNLSLLDTVAPRRVNWRQHVAVLLAMLTLAGAVVLFAKPSWPHQGAAAGIGHRRPDHGHLAVHGGHRCQPGPDHGGEEGREAVPLASCPDDVQGRPRDVRPATPGRGRTADTGPQAGERRDRRPAPAGVHRNG